MPDEDKTFSASLVLDPCYDSLVLQGSIKNEVI